MKYCGIEDCISRTKGYGYCNKHYQRYKKYGQTWLPLRATNKKHPLYVRWKNMRSRCNNSHHPRYMDWGGRGIKICSRRDDFRLYVADIDQLHRPKGSNSLDRIDNDGNYEPGNMRWNTVTGQNINQRVRKDNTTGHKNLYYGGAKSPWLVWIVRQGKTITRERFMYKREAVLFLKSL